MILLDTDVFSEVLRERPAPAVLRWLTASPDVEFATATPVLAELLTGVSTMPEGRRRNTVGQAVEEFLVSLSGRIWSFDEPAAVEYAAIVAERRADGHPIGVVDAQIAAIARSRSASVATRDLDGLRCAGLELVDPWRFGSG